MTIKGGENNMELYYLLGLNHMSQGYTQAEVSTILRGGRPGDMLVDEEGHVLIEFLSNDAIKQMGLGE